MRINRSILSTIATAGLLLFSGSSLLAQNVRLGYCTTDVRTPGLKAQITGSHSFHAAVEFEPSLLNKYAGDQIDSVEFAISPKRGYRAEIFVCTDLDNINQTSLGKASTTDYVDGWNKVKLDNPVNIQSNQTLYIGYILYLNDGEDYDCILFDQSPYGGKAGINWYGYDYNWFNNTGGIDRNLCIRAVASGSNIPNNDVTLLKIDNANGGEYVNQNQPTDYVAYVQNNGSEPVTSLSMTVNAKGQTSDEIACDGFSIPNNEPYAVTLHGISIPVEGNFNGVFTATKVNGQADPYPDDNSVTRYGYSIKEGAQPVHHNVLFEEFTAEANRGSYDADTLYRGAIDLSQQQGVIWVKHHLAYHNIADQFSLGGDKDYTALYGKSDIFTPAICVDRRRISGFTESGPAYFSAYQEVTALLIQQVGNIWSFVELKPTATLDADGTTLNVKVDGHASVNEMQLQNTLKLTTWIVEDSIVSTQQAGQASYIQNGVLRAILTDDIWGDDVDISNYDFSKSYTTTLDPSWNRDHLKVVSFLSNYDADDVTNKTIYNSAEAPITVPTGINSLSDDNATNERIIGIYDMSGRRVDAFNSSHGIYIIKYADGSKVKTKKIIR